MAKIIAKFRGSAERTAGSSARTGAKTGHGRAGLEVGIATLLMAAAAIAPLLAAA